MSKDFIPDYATNVLIPIANPASAEGLLQLASSLCSPVDGELIVLFVALGLNVERDSRSVAEITTVIEKFVEDGYNVRLVTHVSASAARGILDVAREELADLIVLGLPAPRGGQVILGGVVEAVSATAPADMLIYRASSGAEINRVVVAVDGQLPARVASRMGILIGSRYGVPVEAIYVQDPRRPWWEGYGRIAQALADLPGQQAVERSVVQAQAWVSGLLSRITDRDLLIVGVSQRSRLERWLYGSVSREMLNHAPGPLVLIRRSTEAPAAGRLARLRNRFNVTLTQGEQEEVLWKADEMGSATIDYEVLMVIAAILASLGLLLNSAAVIIGAMLVAPLMQPLIGFSTGIATGRLDLVAKSLSTLLQGVLLVLGISVGISLLVHPVDFPTAEMLARTSPSLLDAGVALASGAIGGYATARKDIPSALAGVAIAAALVPPLCTLGLFLGAGDITSSARALLLFFTNIVSIVLAAWAVFFWMGMRPRRIDQSRRQQYISLALVTVLMLPIIAILLSISNRESQTTRIEYRLDKTLTPAEIVGLDVLPGEQTRVVVTVRSAEGVPASQVQSAQNDLETYLREPVQLEVVVLNVIQAGGDEALATDP